MEEASAFTPIPRHRLSDELVARILASIASGEFRSGDRLPPIGEMARTFGVAAATLREALTRSGGAAGDHRSARQWSLRHVSRRDRSAGVPRDLHSLHA